MLPPLRAEKRGPAIGPRRARCSCRAIEGGRIVLNPERIKKFSTRGNEFRCYSFEKHLEMLCLKIIIIISLFRYSRLQNNNLKSILDHFVIEKKANCDEFLINLKNL